MFWPLTFGLHSHWSSELAPNWKLGGELAGRSGLQGFTLYSVATFADVTEGFKVSSLDGMHVRSAPYHADGLFNLQQTLDHILLDGFLEDLSFLVGGLQTVTHQWLLLHLAGVQSGRVTCCSARVKPCEHCVRFSRYLSSVRTTGAAVSQDEHAFGELAEFSWEMQRDS